MCLFPKFLTYTFLTNASVAVVFFFILCGFNLGSCQACLTHPLFNRIQKNPTTRMRCSSFEMAGFELLGKYTHLKSVSQKNAPACGRGFAKEEAPLEDIMVMLS
jgi:hypothetical protein